ncbi:MAG: carboxypeptidase-like regulatory domain-containing protein [Ferruginibacter sp.]
MSAKNKTYTAADFAAYHSGKMPEAEMYALEKAALEDPFLADALEGYVFTPTAENDIAEIKARLKDKNKSAKVFFLTSSNKGLWRAAAAVVIIAGAGILFFNINNKVTDTTLAQTEIRPTVKETPSASSDTIIKEETEKTAIDKNTDALQSNGLAKNEDAIKIGTTQTITTPPSTASAPVGDVMEDKAGKNYDISVEKSARAKEYTLKGKVMDEKGAPVVAASIENKKNKSAVLTDSSGGFALKSDDSSINATASARGYDSKNIALSKDKTTPIELNKNNAALEEVVITDYGTKKSPSVSKKLSGKVAGIQINTNAATPINGTEKYDAYVAESIQRFYDSSATHPTGTVVLSFELSKKGHPKNIFIVSSSCPACNAAAIKILKNGPAWIGKKGQRQTKSFTF